MCTIRYTGLTDFFSCDPSNAQISTVLVQAGVGVGRCLLTKKRFGIVIQPPQGSSRKLRLPLACRLRTAPFLPLKPFTLSGSIRRLIGVLESTRPWLGFPLLLPL